MPHQRAYAEKWGWDFVEDVQPWHEAKWGFMDLLESHLAKYDLLFFVTSDIVFTRPDINPLTFWNASFTMVASACVAMVEARINAGMFLLGGPHALPLLRAWRAMRGAYDGVSRNTEKALEDLQSQGAFPIKILLPRQFMSTPLRDMTMGWQPGDYVYHAINARNKKVRFLQEAVYNHRIVTWTSGGPTSVTTVGYAPDGPDLPPFAQLPNPTPDYILYPE